MQRNLDRDLAYLHREGNTDVYKIGHSIDPRERRGALQTGNSSQLTLILAVAGGYPLEQFLHRWFRDRRTGDGGIEFFSFPEGMPEARQLFLAASDRYREIRQANPGLKGSMLALLADTPPSAATAPARP